MTTERFFARPSIKAVGITGAVFMLGLALGNGWQTREALQGQAAWLHDWCGQQVKGKLAHHQQQDLALYGVTAPR